MIVSTALIVNWSPLTLPPTRQLTARSIRLAGPPDRGSWRASLKSEINSKPNGSRNRLGFPCVWREPTVVGVLGRPQRENSPFPRRSFYSQPLPKTKRSSTVLPADVRGHVRRLDGHTCMSGQRRSAMSKKFTPFAVALTILSAVASAAFAQPNPKHHDNSTVPVSASEGCVDRGKAEEVSSVFREFCW